jgi:hypothetical protein
VSYSIGLVIRAKEILLLPLGFFADVEDLHGDDMPPFGPAAIEEIPVEELRLRAQMVLSKRLGVGLARPFSRFCGPKAVLAA